jgi:hypothetical protein
MLKKKINVGEAFLCLFINFIPAYPEYGAFP